MKKFLIAAVLSCSVALGGCASLSAIWHVTTAPTATQTVLMVDADKVLITAHELFKAAGITLKTAADAGILKGAAAAQAKVYYDQAGHWLQLADQAHDIGNAVLTQQYGQAAIAAIALATTTNGGN